MVQLNFNAELFEKNKNEEPGNVVTEEAPPGFNHFWEDARQYGNEEEEKKRQALIDWAHNYDMNDGSDSRAWMEAHNIKQYGLPEAVPLISMSWNAPDSTFTIEERQELDENYRKHRFWGCYDPSLWDPNWTPEQHIQHWRTYMIQEEHNRRVAEQYQPKKPGRPKKNDTAPKKVEDSAFTAAYKEYIETCKHRKELFNTIDQCIKEARAEVKYFKELKEQLTGLLNPPSRNPNG